MCRNGLLFLEIFIVRRELSQIHDDARRLRVSFCHGKTKYQTFPLDIQKLDQKEKAWPESMKFEIVLNTWQRQTDTNIREKWQIEKIQSTKSESEGLSDDELDDLTVFERMWSRFFVFVVFVSSHGSPGAVRQIFDLLHVLTRALQNFTQQTTEKSNTKYYHVTKIMQEDQKQSRETEDHLSIRSASNGAYLWHTGQVHLGFLSFIWR